MSATEATDRVGVVLAAGFGSRLAAGGDASSNKPLLEVAGRAIKKLRFGDSEAKFCL